MSAPLIVLLSATGGWTAYRLAMALVDGRPSLVLAWASIGSAMVMAAAAIAAARASPAGWLLGWALLTLAAADVTAYRLPDAVTLPLIVAGLALAGSGLDGPEPGIAYAPLALADHSIGAAAGYGALWLVATLYRRARGREGLGLGDAKLAACGGAWLGWRALPLMVLVACGAAFLWAAVGWLRSGRGPAQARIPFGAPLALAIWVFWLQPGWIP